MEWGLLAIKLKGRSGSYTIVISFVSSNMTQFSDHIIY